MSLIISLCESTPIILFNLWRMCPKRDSNSFFLTILVYTYSDSSWNMVYSVIMCIESDCWVYMCMPLSLHVHWYLYLINLTIVALPFTFKVRAYLSMHRKGFPRIVVWKDIVWFCKLASILWEKGKIWRAKSPMTLD